jgi:exopolysaccharide biosynthesis operon protein EpsL
MLIKRRHWLTLALLLACWCGPALAQRDDTLKLKIDSSLRFDQNLFRLPPDVDTVALLGKPSAAERITIDSITLNFSTTLSLQRFEASINLTDYRYQNFNYLSFAAHNYNALWRWSVTPHLHGNLGSQRQETQNSFADYKGFNLQNLRTNTSTRLDAAYDPSGAWVVLAGVSQASQTNQQALTAETDYNERSVDLGVGYVFGSGNTLTYTRRNTDGTYLNQVLPSSGFYDDGFKQINNELKLHWIITGKSSADFNVAHVERSHPNYAQRDYAGLNAGVNFNWNISGKSALSAGWTRELSSYQTSNSNYIQTDRFSLGQVWQFSPKTALRLHYEKAQSDYLGSTADLLTTQRSDSTTGASLSFDWQPYQYLTVSTSLENATRKSNLAGLDYESKMATVSAQFSY